MAFGGFTLTAKGRALLSNAQISQGITFSRIAVGDGTYSGSYSDKTMLTNEKMSLPIYRASSTENHTMLEAVLSNEKLAVGFYLREIGVYAVSGNTEILYAYDNAGADADYIQQADSAVKYEKLIRPIFVISSTVAVSIKDSSAVYITRSEAVTELAKKVNCSSFTSEEILRLIKLVDGVGSNLNAELLCGKTESDFVQITRKIAGIPLNKDLTLRDLGLEKVSNIADSEKNVLTATKLKTTRKIGNANFDGSTDISLSQIGAATPESVTAI
ncbi:MAG: phage tail protein, partial [Oscillospiraceae bacterium]